MSAYFLFKIKKQIHAAIFAFVLLSAAFISAETVQAVGPNPNQPYILINPYLSTTTMANGDTLLIKANVDSNFPVTRGIAQIEGYSIPIEFNILAGNRRSGFWVATWKGVGLTDKTYKVRTTFFDSTGHSYTPAPLEFTDPITGYDTVGDHKEYIAGSILATKINLPEKATIVNGFKIYIDSEQADFRLALYNHDKKLLWQSQSISTDYAGWHEIGVGEGTPHDFVNLEPGDYWLAVQSKDNYSVFASTTTFDSNSAFYQKYLYTAYPTHITKPLYTNKKLSAYMIYNEEDRMLKKFTQRLLSSIKRWI